VPRRGASGRTGITQHHPIRRVNFGRYIQPF
jgi:hypothetical protein